MAVNLPTVPVRKYRRETSSSEVSGCLKYMIFGFNVLFWVKNHLKKTKYIDFSIIQLLGLFILTVGVWAWSEKDIFNNLGKVANVALDPAFILICVGKFLVFFVLLGWHPFFLGTVTFIIGFTGCVGALRENTCLLAAVGWALFINKNLMLIFLVRHFSVSFAAF